MEREQEMNIKRLASIAAATAFAALPGFGQTQSGPPTPTSKDNTENPAAAAVETHAGNAEQTTSTTVKKTTTHHNKLTTRTHKRTRHNQSGEATHTANQGTAGGAGGAGIGGASQGGGGNGAMPQPRTPH